MKLITISALCFFIFACNNKEKQVNETQTSTENVKAETTKDKTFVAKNNLAHAKKDFLSKDILSTDIELYFGGSLRLDAQLLYNPQTTQTLIKYKDGRELLYDGNEVSLSPNTANEKGARFAIFTWSYFLALPYKIDDKGTNLSDFKNKQLNGVEYNVNKLTFGENIGDSPDDWYVLYQDKTTNLLHAASYIVTLGSSVEEGEKDPHAIVYSNYKTVDNIKIANRWDFYGWNEEEGLTDTLGFANLSNIQFLDASAVSFKAKKDAKEIAL